ncbi:MAG: hypothetical protein Q4F95_15720 [Oscillospiraceae bacterium]|nr:hypothetical protein [Oscillospiraceae bacterium]
MKSIIPALLIFILLTIMTSCNRSKIHVDDAPQENIQTSIHQTISTTREHTSKQTTAIQTSAAELTTTIQTTAQETQTLDDKIIESSLLGEISDIDYDAGAAIPYVAWTEINLDKIMYTQIPCSGYELALPDADKKMMYDAGVQLHVIARTDTDYYRIEGDIYIPCDYLDNEIPDAVDASAATSCTVYIPPVITTSAAVSQTSAVSSSLSSASSGTQNS